MANRICQFAKNGTDIKIMKFGPQSEFCKNLEGKRMFFRPVFIKILLSALMLLSTMALEANKKLKDCPDVRVTSVQFLISSQNPHSCVRLQSRNAGMFSVFYDVIALLQSYEEGFFSY
jgi:hypothetical protein